MTMGVRGRYPGGPRRRVAAAHVVTGMSDSGSLIDVAIPQQPKDFTRSTERLVHSGIHETEQNNSIDGLTVRGRLDKMRTLS